MKTFLVAVDGSTVAQAVIDKAVALAAELSARIVLLRVVGLPVELPTDALTGSPQNLEPLLKGAAWESLSAMAERIPKERVAQVRIEVGVPWQTICAIGKAERVDLIILGSHGYGVIDRLLGTTASRVVNHADRDVLVVRPEASRVD